MSKYRGTIFASTKFNAEKAANKLHGALKGLGCDGRVIVDVLTGHSNIQRQEIKHKYKSLYGTELADIMKDELGGDFEKACTALLVPYDEYLIDCLHSATMRADENGVCDIICTAEPWDLRDIQNNYRQKYNSDLLEDLAPKLSKEFEKLIKTRCEWANNLEVSPENLTPQEKDVQISAQILYDAADENEYLEILGQKDNEAIKVLSETYILIAGTDLANGILEKFTGSMGRGFFAIVQCSINVARYFAHQLNNAVRGLGTDDRALIRILVSRSEIDLEDIKNEYLKVFKKSLSEDVADDTSGDYRKLLLKIIKAKP